MSFEIVGVGRDATKADKGRPVFPPPHQYVRTEDIDWVLPCDDTADWSFPGFASTPYDEDNCLCGDNHQSISGIGGAVGNSMSHTFSPAVDFTGKVIVIRFYLHPEGTGVVNPNLNSYMNLRITDSSAKYAEKNKMIQYSQISADRTKLPGWYELAIPVCNLTEGTSPDLSDIVTIRLLLGIAATDKNERITLDRMLAYTPSNATGYYVIRFDVENEIALKAAQVLSERGIRASFGVSPETAISLLSLQKIQAMGHELAHYTRGADSLGWISKSDAEKVETLETACAWFRENGLRSDGAKMICLRGGPGWTANDEMFFRGRYVEVVAGKGPGFTIDGSNACCNLESLWHSGLFYWTDFVTMPSADVAQTRLPAAITLAENNKAVIVLGAHCAEDDGDAGNNEIAALKACADLLAASNLKNVTLGDLYRGNI